MNSPRPTPPLRRRSGPLGLAALGLAATLMTPGCWAPLHRDRATRSEPFEPSTKNSDLVFVRTRDRNYYYILDKKRRLCFFHAPLYGQDHLVNVDCTSFPEYERLIAQSEDRPPDGGAAEPPASPAPEASAPDAADEKRRAFRRAYVQFECKKREGVGEPLEQVLTRFQLTADDWDAAASEVEADDAAWNELEAEVEAACPPAPADPKAPDQR